MPTCEKNENGREFVPELTEEDEAVLDELEAEIADVPDDLSIFDGDPEYSDDELTDDDE